MHTITAEEMNEHPQKLLDDALRGEVALVTAKGVPVMAALPLAAGVPSQAALVDLAATLFDRGEISLGKSARIAGLSYTEMIDELGRRQIDVVRLGPGELERELAAFGP